MKHDETDSGANATFTDAFGSRLADIFGDEQLIRTQTLSGVQQRLRARSALGTFVDLLSVGVETVGHLLNDEDRAADRNQRGR